MIIPFRNFSGEIPRVAPHNLPGAASQYANAVDFASDELVGLRTDSVWGNTYQVIRGVYIHEGNAYLQTTGAWYAWQYDVDVVRSPSVDDQYTRFYWSTGTGVYCSEARNGGWGVEPNAWNKWKVGVPKPGEPMSLAADKLTLANVSNFAAIGFCEDPSGARTNVVNLTASLTGWTGGLLIYTLAGAGWSNCATTPSPAPENTTTTPLSDVGWAERSLGDVSYSLPLFMDIATEVYYVFNPAWGAASWGQQITIDNGGQVGVYWYVGNGWYASTQQAAIPAGSSVAGGTASVTTKPAVELIFSMTDGSTVKAVLREDSSQNTWPSELASYSAVFAQTGSAGTVEIHINSQYARARAYAYTYVNTFEEEGALSDPLILDAVVDGASLALGYTPPPSQDGYRPINKIRVYRTATGAVDTSYLFVGEFVVNNTAPVVSDYFRDHELGESAQTIDFLPPLQTLKGLTVLPNGIMAGFVANEVHLSEPYLPYAWKRANIKTLPNNIVAICATETGLYATTTAHAYLISGVTPDAMVPQKIGAIQGGVSKWSLTSVGPYAVYASNDGLVMLNGLQASLDASFKFFTREAWQRRYGIHLPQLHLNVHDGNLVGWFDNGAEGFMIKLDEAESSLTRLFIPNISASYVSPQYDALFIAAGYAIYEFRKGSQARPWSWWSKDFILPSPQSMGAIQVIGTGIATFSVYADGNLVRQITWEITSVGPEDLKIERLPGGVLARRWSVKIESGNAHIREVYLANTIGELVNA